MLHFYLPASLTAKCLDKSSSALLELRAPGTVRSLHHLLHKAVMAFSGFALVTTSLAE